MDTKLRNNKKISILIAFLLITIAVVIFCVQYPVFKKNVEKYKVNILQAEGFLTNIYRGNAVLYRELTERVAGESVRYRDLYLDIEEKLVDSDTSYYSFGETWSEEAGEVMDSMMEYWEDIVLDPEGIVWAADYCMVDHATGVSISNTGKAIDRLGTDEADEELKNLYPYYIKLSFNDAGFLEHVSVRGENSEELLKAVQNTIGRSRFLSNSFWEQSHFGSEGEDMYFLYEGQTMKASTTVYNAPRNCTVCYAFSRQQMDNLIANDSGRSWYYYYYYSGIEGSLIEICCLLAIFAFFLPLWKRYTLHKAKLVQIPMELAIVIILMELTVGDGRLPSLVSGVNEGSLAQMVSGSLGWLWLEAYQINRIASVIAWCINSAVVYLAFGLWFYLVTSLGQVWELGIRGYLRERSLILRYTRRIWGFCKRKIKSFEDELLHVDLGEKANKTVFKVVAVNFIILGVICAMWLFGWVALIIYTIVIYIVLKKYIQRIQEQYHKLLEATESIAGGNLQTEFDKDWGVFESYKDELVKIQSGFSRAVEEEVKSQKMKTELITNVSHDLKTPLTAITTYIELLKEEDLTREQQKEYLAVLEKKALRLKTLIEDLFEVSKASSGNVTLNLQEVDIGNLIRQVYLEYEDKVEEADLIFRFRMPDEKIVLKLDSQKTYRIFENLYTNIIKYAMPHTRVYVNLEQAEDEIVIELKNMSRVELNIPAESLTERFVRGDSSRNTEGSGLGLAIARSFVELQQGEMKVDIDGDLFKVTIRWKM